MPLFGKKKSNAVDKYIDQFIAQEIAKMDIPKIAQYIVKKTMKKQIRAQIPVGTVMDQSALAIALGQMEFDDVNNNPTQEMHMAGLDPTQAQALFATKQLLDINDDQTIFNQLKTEFPHANTDDLQNAATEMQEFELEISVLPKNQQDLMRSHKKAQLIEEFELQRKPETPSDDTVPQTQSNNIQTAADDAPKPEEQLPDGWRVVYTPHQKTYYQNDITKQTQWDKPTETAQNTLQTSQNTAETAQNTSDIQNGKTEAETPDNDDDKPQETVELIVEGGAQKEEEEEEEEYEDVDKDEDEGEDEEIKPHFAFYILRFIIVIPFLLWAAVEIRNGYEDTVDSGFFHVKSSKELKADLKSDPDAFYDECTSCSMPIIVGIIGFYNEFLITMLIGGITACHRGFSKKRKRKKRKQDGDTKKKTRRSCGTIILHELNAIWAIRAFASSLIAAPPDIYQFKRALNIGQWLGYNCMVYVATTSAIWKFNASMWASEYFMSKKEKEKQQEEERAERERERTESCAQFCIRCCLCVDMFKMYCKNPSLIAMSVAATAHFPGLVAVQFTHFMPFLLVYIWTWIVPAMIYGCCISKAIDYCNNKNMCDKTDNDENKCCKCFNGVMKIIFVPIGAALLYAIFIYMISTMIALYNGTGYIDSLSGALGMEDVNSWLNCSGFNDEYQGYFNKLKVFLVYFI